LDFDRTPRPGLFTTIVVLGELAAIPLAFFIAWLWPDVGLQRIEWSRDGLVLGLLGAIPPGVFALWLLSPAGRKLPFVGRITSMLRELAGATFQALSPVQMVLIAAAAGFGEEILFRGALQPHLGIFITSLLFGLLHPFTLTYAILVVLMGAYLGWLAEHGQGLLAPIVTHAVYNFIALSLIRREMQRMDEPPERAEANG